MKHAKHYDRAAFVLLILAALNWGSVALFNFDFFGYYFGCFDYVPRIIFAVFGLSALYLIGRYYKPGMMIQKSLRAARSHKRKTTTRRKRRRRKRR